MEPFAEIVESSLQSWTAQSWSWDVVPAFGSLVKTRCKNRTLLALVCQIQTGSLDGSRTPFTYKKTEEELRAEQPQIFEFLRTSFMCQVVGYIEDNELYYQLPPEPAKIHSFVSAVPQALLTRFFTHHDYLPLIFGMRNELIAIDELLIALLTYLKKQACLDGEQLERFLQAFCLLIGNDYRRLKLFLRRVEYHYTMPIGGLHKNEDQLR